MAAEMQLGVRGDWPETFRECVVGVYVLACMWARRGHVKHTTMCLGVSACAVPPCAVPCGDVARRVCAGASCCFAPDYVPDACGNTHAAHD